MRYETHHIKDGPTVVRVNKTQARRAFDIMAAPVWLIQSKAAFNSPMNNPCQITRDLPDEAHRLSLDLPNYDFDSRVNEYKYYNCNSEMGHDVRYFITRRDWDKLEEFTKLANKLRVQLRQGGCEFARKLVESCDRDLNHAEYPALFQDDATRNTRMMKELAEHYIAKNSVPATDPEPKHDYLKGLGPFI